MDRIKSYYLGYVTYLTVRDNNIDKQAQYFITASTLYTTYVNNFHTFRVERNRSDARLFLFLAVSSVILRVPRPFLSEPIYDARPSVSFDHRW